MRLGCLLVAVLLLVAASFADASSRRRGAIDKHVVTCGSWGGCTTIGGLGQTVVHVTNTNDSGAGSLRGSIASNRYIVFDVGGTITLASDLPLSVTNLTIDGTTAPTPIVVSGYSWVIDGSSWHDIVLRGFTIQDAVGGVEDDAIRVKNGSYNILVDRMTIDQGESACPAAPTGCDSAIDVTNGSHDITVTYSILHQAGKINLTSYTAYNVLFKNSVFVGSQWRNPNSQWGDAPGSGGLGEGAEAPVGTTVNEVRNNVIWNWNNSGGTAGYFGGTHGGGTIINCGTHANVMTNAYKCNDAGTCTTTGDWAQPMVRSSASDCGVASGGHQGKYYTSGNVSYDPQAGNINTGTEASAYTGPTYAPNLESTACLAMRNALRLAGARPLTSRAVTLLSTITFPGGC